jgi:hypothetical protein
MHPSWIYRTETMRRRKRRRKKRRRMVSTRRGVILSTDIS